MKLRSALVAATMMALPVAANAQAVNGLYVGAGVGINFTLNEQVKSSRGNNITNLRSTVGPAAVLSLGWGFGNGLRAELEGSYRYNQINGGTFNAGPAGSSLGGKEQKMGVMVNALYDFVGVVPMVQPYIGVGVGYQWGRYQLGGGIPTGAFAGTLSSPTSTQGAFAYQANLGAALPIASIPGLALTAEYRFMGMTGNRSYSTTVVSAAGVRTAGSYTLNSNLNNSVLFGVRYNFGQAPAPAPAAAIAPAAQAARSYLVFFDWDKYSLSDRAKQIIKEAAENSRKVQYTRIEVNGFTDTSGTPKYNMGLSIRRANAVAAELVKNGVPRNAITAQGFGETKLLVPTGPNVREPQNRRVEIILR